MRLLATSCNTCLAACTRYFKGLAGNRSQIKCLFGMLDAVGDGVSVRG